MFRKMSQAIGNVGVAIGLRALLSMNRDEACNQIADLVNSGNEHRIRAFEENFLKHSLTLFNPDYRTRAMELYSFFKVCEGNREGQFCGFITPGGTI